MLLGPKNNEIFLRVLRFLAKSSLCRGVFSFFVLKKVKKTSKNLKKDPPPWRPILVGSWKSRKKPMTFWRFLKVFDGFLKVFEGFWRFWLFFVNLCVVFLSFFVKKTHVFYRPFGGFSKKHEKTHFFGRFYPPF